MSAKINSSVSFSEHQSILEQTLKCELDLANPETRKINDALNSAMWRTITRVDPPNCNEIFSDLVKESLERTRSFPIMQSRVFELAVAEFFASNMKNQTLHTQASEFLEKLSEARRKPEIPLRSVHFFRASLLYYEEDSSYYSEYLRGHQELISKSVVTPFMSYSRSIAPPIRYEELRTAVAQRGCINVSRVPCILVAANSTYVTKYLYRYMESLVEVGYIGIFHLHWLKESSSEDITAEETIQSAKRLTRSIELKITQEVPPNIRDMRSYYASSRYLIARKLLKEHQLILITDMDYQAVGSLDEFLDTAKGYDITLQIRTTGLADIFPWLNVTAGTVTISNTNIGRLFLDLYAQQFYSIYSPAGFNWGIDQNILGSLARFFSPLGAVGNNLNFGNPFTVPYDIKHASL